MHKIKSIINNKSCIKIKKRKDVEKSYINYNYVHYCNIKTNLNIDLEDNDNISCYKKIIGFLSKLKISPNIKQIYINTIFKKIKGVQYLDGSFKYNGGCRNITNKSLKYLYSKGRIKLKKLIIPYRNNIDGRGLKYLCDLEYLDLSHFYNINIFYFNKLKQLKTINISCNSRLNTLLLQNNHNLVEINFFNCGCSIDVLTNFPKSLISLKLSAIKGVGCNRFIVTDEIILNIMKHSTNIRHLNVAYSLITDNIFHIFKNLKSLSIYNCSYVYGSKFNYLENLELLDARQCSNLNEDGFKYLIKLKKLIR